MIAGSEWLVRILAHSWRRSYPQFDYEDLASELRLGVVQAAARYAPVPDVPFTAYARHYALKRVDEFVRREIRRPTNLTGLEQLAADLPSSEPRFFEDFWDRVAELVGDPRRAAVVEMRYREGRSLAECGRILGISKRRVIQLEREAIAGLKEVMPTFRTEGGE